MLLRHLRLPFSISYHHASALQDHLVAALLASKPTRNSTTSPSSPNAAPPPLPTLLTTSFNPIYTCGRRELSTVTTSQKAHLLSTGADFHSALRGGQTTFHGPGQLIGYPIIDLKAHKLGARAYVELLEATLIGTLARFGIRGLTTENPGVWTTPDRKIAALGVHLRRNVTSHGIALNVDTDLTWFENIVACGLEGKETTNFVREGVVGIKLDEVRDAFVEEFAARLDGVEGVAEVKEDDLES
ncbi:MAG: hypothetical protein M4579_003142 [Chaenotheca gracillima]|nr:MAG: hypothetical protein M4579_003142 [Chaenotheca gracillima]